MCLFHKAGPKTGPHSWVVKWLVISHIQGTASRGPILMESMEHFSLPSPTPNRRHVIDVVLVVLVVIVIVVINGSYRYTDYC